MAEDRLKDQERHHERMWKRIELEIDIRDRKKWRWNVMKSKPNPIRKRAINR